MPFKQCQMPQEVCSSHCSFKRKAKEVTFLPMFHFPFFMLVHLLYSGELR